MGLAPANHLEDSNERVNRMIAMQKKGCWNHCHLK
ncbi:hypothetical protein HU200_021196 [Digitaria exilis]|uniref:Uncharacterized protein n=1 Tax=Digitaria exilis TaxID=1010633 RepID=A0A835KBM9_9POAL|nr:hypothetical protein HU200_021196 [Digitaria exilis]